MAGYDDTSHHQRHRPDHGRGQGAGRDTSVLAELPRHRRVRLRRRTTPPTTPASQAAKVRHPNLIVLDWNGYTYGAAGGRRKRRWFESDDIHMTRAGGARTGHLPEERHRRAATSNAAMPSNATAGTPSPASRAHQLRPPRRDRLRPVTPRARARHASRWCRRRQRQGRAPGGRSRIDLAVGAARRRDRVPRSTSPRSTRARSGYLTVYACGDTAEHLQRQLRQRAAPRPAWPSRLLDRPHASACTRRPPPTSSSTSTGAFAPSGTLFHRSTPRAGSTRAATPAVSLRRRAVLPGGPSSRADRRSRRRAGATPPACG